MKETRFKDTEVGRIPADWNIKRLGENILFLRTGLNPRVHFKLNTPDADGFYITVRELQGFDIVVNEQTDRINCQAAKRIDERSKLEIGDVLFSGTGTIGQTALVKEKPTNWGIKEGIYAITPNHNKLVSPYLIYYLHTSKAVSLYSSMSSGSTINSVPMTKFVNLPIPLPSLSEQNRIAVALSNVDALIAELDKLIEKKRAIKQGAMQQLLTGKKRLKGFNEPWVEYEIRNICEVKRGVRVVKNQLNTGGKFPVFQNTNIPLGYFDNYNVDKCTPFVIIGGSAGQIGICYTKYWAADDCAYFECSNMILKEFLYLILLHNQKMILQNVRTGTVPRLDRSVLQKLRIRIPSNIQEQHAITNICSNMEKEVTHLEVKKAKYESIKQGMMQQLLTGKIRLK